MLSSVFHSIFLLFITTYIQFISLFSHIIFSLYFLSTFRSIFLLYFLYHFSFPIMPLHFSIYLLSSFFTKHCYSFFLCYFLSVFLHSLSLFLTRLVWQVFPPFPLLLFQFIFYSYRSDNRNTHQYKPRGGVTFFLS